MGGGEPNNDGRSREELNSELLNADWHVSSTAVSTYGVTVTFRKHYTSDFPGMETRVVHGQNEEDAIRRFLAELRAESSG